jgi:hypothetical protein
MMSLHRPRSPRILDLIEARKGRGVARKERCVAKSGKQWRKSENWWLKNKKDLPMLTSKDRRGC